MHFWGDIMYIKSLDNSIRMMVTNNLTLENSCTAFWQKNPSPLSTANFLFVSFISQPTKIFPTQKKKKVIFLNQEHFSLRIISLFNYWYQKAKSLAHRASTRLPDVEVEDVNHGDSTARLGIVAHKE